MNEVLRLIELVLQSMAVVHFIGGFLGASLATLASYRLSMSLPLIGGTVVWLGWQMMDVFAHVRTTHMPLAHADMGEISFSLLVSGVLGASFAWFVGMAAADA